MVTFASASVRSYPPGHSAVTSVSESAPGHKCTLSSLKFLGIYRLNVGCVAE